MVTFLVGCVIGAGLQWALRDGLRLDVRLAGWLHRRSLRRSIREWGRRPTLTVLPPLQAELQAELYRIIAERAFR